MTELGVSESSIAGPPWQLASQACFSPERDVASRVLLLRSAVQAGGVTGCVSPPLIVSNTAPPGVWCLALAAYVLCRGAGEVNQLADALGLSRLRASSRFKAGPAFPDLSKVQHLRVARQPLRSLRRLQSAVRHQLKVRVLTTPIKLSHL